MVHMECIYEVVRLSGVSYELLWFSYEGVYSKY